jgi:hypothetical protein
MTFLHLEIYFFILDLDKVTNLTFEKDSRNKTRALIHFNSPRKNFEQIYLTCSTQDKSCSKDSYILSNTAKNCLNCTPISIYPIIPGVKYKCQATTMKDNFPNTTSNYLDFNTSMSLSSLV